MIVTGGVINKLGEYISSKDEFIPVEQIAKVFSNKLLSLIKSNKRLEFYNQYEHLKNKNKLNEFL